MYLFSSLCFGFACVFIAYQHKLAMCAVFGKVRDKNTLAFDEFQHREEGGDDLIAAFGMVEQSRKLTMPLFGKTFHNMKNLFVHADMACRADEVIELSDVLFCLQKLDVALIHAPVGIGEHRKLVRELIFLFRRCFRKLARRLFKAASPKPMNSAFL